MSEKIPLRKQHDAIISLYAQAKGYGLQGDKEALQAACETLLWLGRNEKEIKLGIQIAANALKDEGVAALVEQFTGISIVTIRKTKESAKYNPAR